MDQSVPFFALHLCMDSRLNGLLQLEQVWVPLVAVARAVVWRRATLRPCAMNILAQMTERFQYYALVELSCASSWNSEREGRVRLSVGE